MNETLWTMNCVIAGAEVAKLIQQGQQELAREVLQHLTSELNVEDISYLMARLETLTS